MVSLFDMCTGFQIIVCITLFSGIIYGRHKKTVPLKALIIHNALYLVWAVTVTAVVAKNLLIWWPVFFLAFFISHAIFGKRRKKNWQGTGKKLAVPAGMFAVLFAGALIFGGIQIAAYYFPMMTYTLPFETGSALAGGLFVGLLFSWTDRKMGKQAEPSGRGKKGPN